MKFYPILLLGISVVVLVEGSLPVEKTCGETLCPDHHFCSPIDHHCRPCEQICNRNSSNYDYARCEAGCQDYLHDTIYLRRNETTMPLNLATKEDIDVLRTQLYILLFTTFTTWIFLVIFGVLKFFKFLNGRRRMAKKKSIAMPIIYNNKYGKELEAKAVVMENNNENKRRSIKLEREPSESTLPDYSYDNPTLSVSQSPINTV